MQRIYFSNLSRTLGFEALFVFFNLTLVLFAIFLYLGISCAISLGPALATLESLFNSPADWKERFDSEMTLGAAQTLTSTFYVIESVACLVVSAMLLVLLAQGIKIGQT